MQNCILPVKKKKKWLGRFPSAPVQMCYDEVASYCVVLTTPNPNIYFYDEKTSRKFLEKNPGKILLLSLAGFFIENLISKLNNEDFY